MVCFQIKICGKVQGVFFRDHIRSKASELGLKGYVKNLNNGEVEAVADGPSEKIKSLIDYCWQGSPLSRVRDVKVYESKNLEDFSSFEIR